LKELQDHARQIEDVIAALEELADQEGNRRIRSGLKEYEEGEYMVVEDPKEMESLLGDWSLENGSRALQDCGYQTLPEGAQEATCRRETRFCWQSKT
jgi:hypothetical protein